MAAEPDRQEILELVTRAVQAGPLGSVDEARLRTLLARHNPSAPRLTWDELYHASLFTLGVWITFQPETLGVQG